MSIRAETVWPWLSAILPLVLAVLGVAVTFFPPLTDENKYIWLGVFVILGFAAFLATRQEQLSTKRAHAHLLKSITGGDGYCYFVPLVSGNGMCRPLTLLLVNNGEFPLYDMKFSVKQNPWRIATEAEMVQILLSPSLHAKDYGTVHKGAAIMGYALPEKPGNYQIDIVTRNGRFSEIIQVIRKGGTLVPRLRVHNDTHGKAELLYSNPREWDMVDDPNNP